MARILTWFVVKTCKQGAQTTIHVAVSEDVKGVSGEVILLIVFIYLVGTITLVHLK